LSFQSRPAFSVLLHPPPAGGRKKQTEEKNLAGCARRLRNAVAVATPHRSVVVSLCFQGRRMMRLFGDRSDALRLYPHAIF